MPDKLGTKGIASAISLLLGTGIVTSQTPVVATGLTFVAVGPGFVADGLAEGVMKTFGMA